MKETSSTLACLYQHAIVEEGAGIDTKETSSTPASFSTPATGVDEVGQPVLK